jgi:hypothetical protein
MNSEWHTASWLDDYRCPHSVETYLVTGDVARGKFGSGVGLYGHWIGDPDKGTQGTLPNHMCSGDIQHPMYLDRGDGINFGYPSR